MTVSRAARALLMTGSLAVVLGTSACSFSGIPVIPKDHCKTIKADSSEADIRADGQAGPLTPSGPIRMPVEPGTTQFTSGFGERWGAQHQGVDLAGPVGTKILAALDGIVVKSGTASGFGHWIVIDSNVDGKPVSTVYGHMFADGLHVREGQQVRSGDHIADIGNDGGSTAGLCVQIAELGLRINRGAALESAAFPVLEVQMRTGAPAVVSDVGDVITGAHLLAFTHM